MLWTGSLGSAVRLRMTCLRMTYTETTGCSSAEGEDAARGRGAAV